MNDDSRDVIRRSAQILQRTMPGGPATKADALFFWGAAPLLIVTAFGAGISTMVALGLAAEDFGGLVSIVILFGSIVAGLTLSGVALRWLRSRGLAPLAGCALVPAVLVIAMFVGWWIIVLVLTAAVIDMWRRTDGRARPPLSGG